MDFCFCSGAIRGSVDWQKLMLCVVEASRGAGGAVPGWIPWDFGSMDLVDSYLCRVRFIHGPPGAVQTTHVQLFDMVCLDVVKEVLVQRLQEL
jgi:hypothetical protein